MIMVGLVFRSLCMKLTSINQRKERVRGGLKQIAESMNYVTRSMSNDLYVLNSPRSVIRTYSNYNTRRRGRTWICRCSVASLLVFIFQAREKDDNRGNIFHQIEKMKDLKILYSSEHLIITET